MITPPLPFRQDFPSWICEHVGTSRRNRQGVVFWPCAGSPRNFVFPIRRLGANGKPTWGPDEYPHRFRTCQRFAPRLTGGVFLTGHRFFQNFCFSDTLRTCQRFAPRLKGGVGLAPTGVLSEFLFFRYVDIRGELAEWTGLEPATLGVTGRYSKPTELPLRF